MSRYRKYWFILLTIFNFLLVNSAFAQQVKLLSLNVKQFPYGISKDNKNRANRLIKVIKENYDQFDVIALQELWYSDMRNYISKSLEQIYPYQLKDTDSGAWRVGVNSGLIILSKFEIKRNTHFSYTHYRGDENLAKKGVTGVEIDVNGKTIYLFTTHLQADIDGTYLGWLDTCGHTASQIREIQFKEINEVVHSFATDPIAPTFLVGDLNTVAYSDDYKNAIGILSNSVDTFDPSHSKYSGSSWNDFPSTTRIDYIITLRSHVDGYSEIIDKFGPNITDHLGVTGTFNF